MSCMSEPQPQHRWLQKLVGDWTYEGECSMGPDKPPEKMTGTESVRAIGDLWIVGEARGEMPDGGPATMITTIGYDVAKKAFVGTWIGSMMDRLWVYDITFDEERQSLAMECDGPAFDDENKTVRYRDAMEVKDDNHRIFTSALRNDDGTWMTFMTSHFHRK